MAHETKIRRRHRGGEAHAGAEADGTGTRADERSLLTAERFMPWVVGAIALLVYLGTMTPAMQMGDGTELAAAAQVLGVPHPTGYPLYMLLCKLWLVLTIGGEVITRTTMLNCLIMAGAAGLTSVIIKDLLRVCWSAAVSKPMLITAALTGLLTAFLRFHWENAVVTEVYALQFLLTLIFVRIVQRMDLSGGTTRRGLIWLTVVFAMAMAHHRLSVTLILPWVGVWFWAWRRAKSDSPVPLRMTKGLVAVAGLILAGGAALYLYIPLRAAQEPPINWGNVTSASAFYHHVRGTEYLDRGLMKPGLGQTFSGGSAMHFALQQSRQIVGDLWAQIVPSAERFVLGPRGSQTVFIFSKNSMFPGLLVLVAGAWGWWRASRRNAQMTVLAVVFIAAQNIGVLYVYNIADIRDYYLFPFWAIIAGLPLACPEPGRYKNRLMDKLGLFVMAALMASAWIENYARCNRSDDITAEFLSATILPESAEVMPPGSILITDDDPETFTTWYRQVVRADRPDVLNFAGNFVYMPWYRAFFTEEELEEFEITLAGAVARNAEEYAGQLRRAIIDKNVADHAIFTSINDPEVLTVLAVDFVIMPVDAVEIVNPVFDELTTTVLYRIQPKDQSTP